MGVPSYTEIRKPKGKVLGFQYLLSSLFYVWAQWVATDSISWMCDIKAHDWTVILLPTEL